MKIEIEKGVPIPDSAKGRPPKYPWREMEIGDSFWCEKRIGTASGMATAAKKRCGFDFLCNREERNGVMGSRIWRVK